MKKFNCFRYILASTIAWAACSFASATPTASTSKNILTIEMVKLSETSPTLKKIKATGAINLGIREDASPFADIKDGVPKGYSVEICKKIVQGLEAMAGRSLQVHYIPVTAKTRINAVKDGTIDLECGSTTHTSAREKEVNFTLPIFITGIRMATLASAQNISMDNLKDKVLAVVSKSTGAFMLERKMGNVTSNVFTIKLVADNDSGVQAVAKGEAHAFFTDDVLLAGSIVRNKLQSSIKRQGPLLSIEPYALMVRKGDDDFVSFVDRILKEVFMSGEALKLAKKWMDTPELGYSINGHTLENFRRPIKMPALDM